jgi:hypothetical protein
MNIDNFISSSLKVTASENLNIENDLNSQSKDINELLNEKKDIKTEKKSEFTKEKK